MEVFELNEDLTIACVTAKSFPDGIEAAFNTLEGVFSSVKEKTLFGISKPENNIIVYRAGVLVSDWDEKGLAELQKIVLHKGTYLKKTVVNWKDNLDKISIVFEELLRDHRLDPESYCIEWYDGEDVACLIQLII